MGIGPNQDGYRIRTYLGGVSQPFNMVPPVKQFPDPLDDSIFQRFFILIDVDWSKPFADGFISLVQEPDINNIDISDIVARMPWANAFPINFVFVGTQMLDTTSTDCFQFCRNCIPCEDNSEFGVDVDFEDLVFWGRADQFKSNGVNDYFFSDLTAFANSLSSQEGCLSGNLGTGLSSDIKYGEIPDGDPLNSTYTILPPNTGDAAPFIAGSQSSQIDVQCSDNFGNSIHSIAATDIFDQFLPEIYTLFSVARRKTVSATPGGYIYVSTPMLFDEANNYCIANYGSTLASVTSASANAAAVALCPGTCWFGLRQLPNEGEWYWIDGSGTLSQTGYSNWLTNEPNNVVRQGVGENDGQIRGNGWNDEQGFLFRYPFICNPTPISSTADGAIFSSKSIEFCSGFGPIGQIAFAKHGNFFITGPAGTTLDLIPYPETEDKSDIYVPTLSVLLSTDQLSLYRAQGVQLNEHDDGSSLPNIFIQFPNFGVNVGDKTQSSFELYEMLIFNRELTLEEICCIEVYLARFYGFYDPLTWPDCCVEIDFISVTLPVAETGCAPDEIDTDYGPFFSVSNGLVAYACDLNDANQGSTSCAPGYQYCTQVPDACDSAIATLLAEKNDPAASFRVGDDSLTLCGNDDTNVVGILCCEIQTDDGNPDTLATAHQHKTSKYTKNNDIDDEIIIETERFWSLSSITSLLINVVCIIVVSTLWRDISKFRTNKGYKIVSHDSSTAASSTDVGL